MTYILAAICMKTLHNLTNLHQKLQQHILPTQRKLFEPIIFPQTFPATAAELLQQEQPIPSIVSLSEEWLNLKLVLTSSIFTVNIRNFNQNPFDYKYYAMTNSFVRIKSGLVKPCKS